MKGRLAEKKPVSAKTPLTPSESLESEIKQLALVQKQANQSLNQIWEALIEKTQKVINLINLGREEEQKNRRQRQRDEEEYRFDLSLRQKKEEAEFEEKLSDRQKRLTEKETELEEKETEFQKLQAQAAGFPKQIEQAVKETGEKLTAELKKEKEAEIKFLTQKFENELSLAQFKIKSLTEAKEKQEKEISQLKDQLARSAREVKEIAVAVIEARGKTEKTKPEEKNESEQKFA